MDSLEQWVDFLSIIILTEIIAVRILMTVDKNPIYIHHYILIADKKKKKSFRTI